MHQIFATSLLFSAVVLYFFYAGAILWGTMQGFSDRMQGRGFHPAPYLGTILVFTYPIFYSITYLCFTPFGKKE